MESGDRIEWDEGLAFGLAEIDLHHEQILRQLKIFERAIEAGKELKAVGELLQYLQTFTHEHFEEEEAFLEYIGYPALEDHRRLHKHYLRELQKVASIYADEGPSEALIAGVQAKLVKGILDHITVEDKKCAAFALKPGV
jgi:hemerythrin